MRRACTCAIKRAFMVSSDTLAQSTSRSSTRIPITTISTSTSTTTKRSFSSVHALKYPRQATPFSAAHRAKAANQDVREEDLDSLIDEVVVEPLEATGSSSSTSGKSAPLASTWYLSETPASSTSYTQAKDTASKAPEVPTPPSKLPTYLKPLWDHLYESPFLDQATINFIDSNAVQENVSDNDMDASVSSWVDWVVVASLRRGREKGIRGASEAVKMAVSCETSVCMLNLSAES